MATDSHLGPVRQDGRLIVLETMRGARLGTVVTRGTGVEAFLPDGRCLGFYPSWRAALEELYQRWKARR